VCSLLFLASSYSYSEEYIQQYQVGDVGPNGGEVTSVTVNEVYVGEEVVQDGDFLEVTHTYEYTETIIEQVEEVSFTTVTEVTSVTTPNLITDDSTYTDTNVSVGGNFGMPGADFTTGHEGLSGGTRMYEGGFENENIQTLDYGVTVHSHSSNTSVPACSNTTSDCRDDFSVTVSLYYQDELVDTLTHSYTGMNWAGSRDYEWSEDVSALTFDYGTMELYGIDRGFYSGYYGPGFSDPYVRATYNVMEQVIQRVVEYVQMETIRKSDVYVYESIYNPPVQIVDIQIEPLTDTDFEVLVFEIDEVGNEVVEVFEVEVSELEVEIGDEMEPVSIEVDDSESEPVAIEEVSEETETVQESSEDVEQSVEVAEESEDEQPRPTTKVRKSSNYSPVLDSIKVALMVQNEASRAFTAYQQETVPDVPFYSPVDIDGGNTVDNPMAQWLIGASEILWDDMVDSQWQK
jgi:hypothetical protein